jgi:hypothetical protein
MKITAYNAMCLFDGTRVMEENALRVKAEFKQHPIDQDVILKALDTIIEKSQEMRQTLESEMKADA